MTGKDGGAMEIKTIKDIPEREMIKGLKLKGLPTFPLEE
jgi:hypothetical protein